MAPTKQSGKGTRNGVREASGNALLDSMVSHGYNIGLVDANGLSVDSSTVAAKKGGSRRLDTTVTTRRRREAKYMQ